MGNKAKMLDFSASDGASSAAPSPAGGVVRARTAGFRAFARQLRCDRWLASLADIFPIYPLRRSTIYIYSMT